MIQLPEALVDRLRFLHDAIQGQPVPVKASEVRVGDRIATTNGMREVLSAEHTGHDGVILVAQDSSSPTGKTVLTLRCNNYVTCLRKI